MNIALLEPLGVPDTLIEQLSQPIRDAGHSFIYYRRKAGSTEELAQRSEGCEVVMIANTRYPDEVVRSASQLRMLDVAFTGIDHVGLAACREKDVMICNAANYSNQTVAELVIGMTISLLRRISEGDSAVRSAGTSAGLCGREIAGRTVGVIGLGRIGMITARLFLAFGARVIACDTNRSAAAEALGIRYVPLAELMAASDIVTLHTPNLPSTRGLISRDMLRLMKPTAIFINCARGPIVDNAALAEALHAGALAGAAIDVYDMEPPIPADYPLLSAPNTLLTPHVAFLSEESMVRRAHIAFDNVTAYLRGQPQNVCSY